jgi:hypothetical protein
MLDEMTYGRMHQPYFLGRTHSASIRTKTAWGHNIQEELSGFKDTPVKMLGQSLGQEKNLRPTMSAISAWQRSAK